MRNKKIKETKAIITPKDNLYFDLQFKTVKRKMTPFEKSWMEFKKSEAKKKKEKSKKRFLNKNKDAIIFLCLLVIAASVGILKYWMQYYNITGVLQKSSFYFR